MALAFFALCFVIIFGAFRAQLSGSDYEAAPDEVGTSIAHILILASIYFLFVAIAIWRIQRTTRLFFRNFPLYLLPIVALASTLWSINQSNTAATSIAYCLPFLCGLALNVVYSRESVLRTFLQASTLILLASFVMVIVLPQQGVHQGTDFFQSSHEGSWRGVFNHRTKLGQFSAIFICCVLVFGRPYSSKIYFYFRLVLAAVCLVFSNSTGAYLTLLTGLASIGYLKISVRWSVRAKIVGLIFMAMILLTCSLTWDLLLSSILELIGKTTDLTGRAPLWTAIFNGVDNSGPFGLGYSAGFNEVIRPVLENSGYGFLPNSQSGYVDAWVSFGVLGPAVLLFFAWKYIAVGVLSYIRLTDIARSDPAHYLLPVMLVLITLQISFVESFIWEANNFLVPILGMLLPLSFSKGRV